MHGIVGIIGEPFRFKLGQGGMILRLKLTYLMLRPFQSLRQIQTMKGRSDAEDFGAVLRGKGVEGTFQKFRFKQHRVHGASNSLIV